MRIIGYFISASLCLILSGCQFFQPTTDMHKVQCKEMKSRLMFNGKSTNPGRAFSEKADGRLLNRDYHNDCN